MANWITLRVSGELNTESRKLGLKAIDGNIEKLNKSLDVSPS